MKNSHWTTNKERLAKANSKALYVIFCSVDQQEFKRVSNCIIVKESFALGEEYCNTKLVNNVLRSFPKIFFIEVTATKEAKNHEILKIDELIETLSDF
uniref:Uncharacterized protein n=1 Tax=Gossypium raimondii TaxID=29730 RepID=A0A0D2T3X0_GOSRA|nr:hypothetical protein B456_011G071600 [Gossypium raimondii]